MYSCTGAQQNSHCLFPEVRIPAPASKSNSRSVTIDPQLGRSFSHFERLPIHAERNVTPLLDREIKITAQEYQLPYETMVRKGQCPGKLKVLTLKIRTALGLLGKNIWQGIMGTSAIPLFSLGLGVSTIVIAAVGATCGIVNAINFMRNTPEERFLSEYKSALDTLESWTSRKDGFWLQSRIDRAPQIQRLKNELLSMRDECIRILNDKDASKQEWQTYNLLGCFE